MEALRLNPETKTFGLDIAPIPKVESPTDVVIQVKYAGLCGTDIHIIGFNFSEKSSPTTKTLGHEFAGVVKDLGEAAKQKFKIGDRVGVDPNRGCYACNFCAQGNVHFCQTGGLRYAVGVHMDGGFAPQSKAHMGQVFKLPDAVSFQQGALCEPLSCLQHGWQRLQKFGGAQPESKVLILGAGIIGNLWVSLLHHSGFRDVTVSEPSETRRKITKGIVPEFNVIAPSELVEVFPTDPLECALNGIDIVVDTSGYPPALEQAIKLTRRGAIVCVFGCAPPGKTMQVSPEEIFGKELVIFGTLVNPNTYERATKLAANMGDKYLDLEKLGVKVYSLKEYEEGINNLKAGKISKVMFKHED